MTVYSKKEKEKETSFWKHIFFKYFLFCNFMFDALWWRDEVIVSLILSFTLKKKRKEKKKKKRKKKKEN